MALKSGDQQSLMHKEKLHLCIDQICRIIEMDRGQGCPSRTVGHGSE